MGSVPAGASAAATTAGAAPAATDAAPAAEVKVRTGYN